MRKPRKKRSKAGQQFVSNKLAGRSYQRRIAKRWAGKSVGTIEGQDVEHPVFSIECKKMKKFPTSFVHAKKVTNKKTKETRTIYVGWWDQTLQNCPKNKIPVLLMHRTKDRFEDDLVVIRLGDFEKLVNPKTLKEV
jgi:hypothetical protein